MSKSRRCFLAASVAAATVLPLTSVQAKSGSSDPEMDRIFDRLLKLGPRAQSLSSAQKYYVLIATATAQALPEVASRITSDALKAGVNPIALKEALYQTAPYCGMGRVETVLGAVNAALERAGVQLPLAPQATVTDENRLAKGIEVQTAIFGETIAQMHQNTPESQRALLIDDLSGWCFGDFYTRSGLSIADRELCVFAAIAALGGCEPQLKAHIGANLKEGVSKQNLIDALQAALPLNGFPRTLNALALVNAAS